MSKLEDKRRRIKEMNREGESSPVVFTNRPLVEVKHISSIINMKWCLSDHHLNYWSGFYDILHKTGYLVLFAAFMTPIVVTLMTRSLLVLLNELMIKYNNK